MVVSRVTVFTARVMYCRAVASINLCTAVPRHGPFPLTGQERATARFSCKVARHATEHPFAEARVTIGAAMTPAPTLAAILSSCSLTLLGFSGTIVWAAIPWLRSHAATSATPRHLIGAMGILFGNFRARDFLPPPGHGARRIRPGALPACPSRRPERSKSSHCTVDGTTMSGRPACITRSLGSGAAQDLHCHRSRADNGHIGCHRLLQHVWHWQRPGGTPFHRRCAVSTAARKSARVPTIAS